MPKWNGPARIRVNSQGATPPHLGNLISKARSVAGDLMATNKSDFSRTVRDLGGGAKADVYVNTGVHKQHPLVTLDIYVPQQGQASRAQTVINNEGKGDFIGSIAIFIGDETQPIYSSSAGGDATNEYLDDESQLRAIYGDDLISRRSSAIGILQIPSGGPLNTIWPIPEYAVVTNAPTRISSSVVREEDCIAAINNTAARVAGRINKVFLLLDNSGSMTLTTVPTGAITYAQTVTATQDPSTVVVASLSSERWIKEFLDFFGAGAGDQA